MSNVKSTKELERKARIFSLFSDPNRLRILQLLTLQKRVKVSDIAEEIKMSVACTSHHLQLLKDNQVVESTREGNNIFYQIIDDPFIKKLQNLIIKK